MGRRTKSDRRSDSTRSSPTISKGRSTETSRQGGMDALSRGIHVGIQGRKETEGSQGTDETLPGIQAGSEDIANGDAKETKRSDSFICRSEVIYDTETTKLIRERVAGGFLYTKEYFTRDIFRERRRVSQVCMAFVPQAAGS